ncbi:MAG: DUF4112 domain-containing protein [Verrucomicrobiota bacterium]|nr:DUF4112 domain-containing protein [Verrucomicrobiota bacterium]
MSEAKEVKWERLPPESPPSRAEPLFRWVALVMDELLRLPGTKFRFGLDPLIGLIPGIGDTASALVSALTLIQAARLGVPKVLLARMSLNILINEVVGIIPVAGDAFSFWFKSNTRNHAMLRAHLGEPHRRRTGDWIFLGAILGLLALVVGIGLLVSFLVLRAVFHLFRLG